MTHPRPRPAWRFDHVHVVTNAHPQALAFFRDVMGWASGERPPFPFPGDWLYQGEDALLHAAHAGQESPTPALRLHHVAFRSDEKGADVLARVRASGLAHTVSAVPGEATLQIFVSLPGGLVIELNTPLDPGLALDAPARRGDVSFDAARRATDVPTPAQTVPALTPPSLFTPLKLGAIDLPHRVVMAPMTRARTTQPGNVPNALMAAYYAQRAGAGLIVTEATQVSPQGQGYSFTPGLHTETQVHGWKQVTGAVHARGGRIFAQLWHVGRMSHPVFHGGELPVAPSALAPDAQVWVAGDDGVGRMVDCPVPRALTLQEIAAIVQDFRRAAANAMRAGFDGVEIHGANGYLIDQFLRSSSNRRTDAYGGSRERRVRFLLEVAQAVAAEVGAGRVGVRLAPFITARNMACPDIIPTVIQAARGLSALGVAYLHLSEADGADVPQVPEGFRRNLRSAFAGRLMVAGGYDLARAQAIVQGGLADLVAFGRPFIANPDLPDRLRRGLPLAAPDAATWFGGAAEGYTSYPAWHDGAPAPASHATPLQDA